MSDEPRLLEVGRIGKPHGLCGEVVVTSITDRDERWTPGSVFETDQGPLAIASSRPHQGRWLVRFDGTADRSEAEALRGLVLRAEALDDPATLWVHELIGCTVVDRAGLVRGTVESVEENPASDLLVLDSGALVPARFIVGTPVDGRVEVDDPDGLFDDDVGD